jgi:hypothetical protein
MNSEQLLLLLKLKEISKYLYLSDLIELSLTCSLINDLLKPLLSQYFVMSTTKYEIYFHKGQNTAEFEKEANQYLKRDSNSLKVIKIVNYPLFYIMHLDLGDLSRLTTIYLSRSLKLTELNKLLNFSRCLTSLSLFRVIVTDDESEENSLSYVKLPSTLTYLYIDSFVIIMENLYLYTTSMDSEMGNLLFGNDLHLPNLKALTCIQFSREQKNLLNFLLAKSPNLTMLETRFDIINQISYELLNIKCPYLTDLKLWFNCELIATERNLNDYKFANGFDLVSLIGILRNNLIYTYLACKSCPNLTKLSLLNNYIDISNLSQVLLLLPQIEKLTLANCFKERNFNDLEFSNSTIKHLVLSKFDTINLSNLIKYVKSWTKLKHISIESSEEGKAVDIDGDSKLELSLKPWKCYVFTNSIQLWIE